MPHDADRTRPALRGFTIIELLVVLMIISGLLAILLPVLPRVRDSARRVACMANLRSVGQSLHIYLDENREVFPEARYMPPPFLSADPDPPLNEALASVLDPDSPVWICPGDDIVHEQEYLDDNNETRAAGVSYTYMIMLSGRRLEDTFPVRRFGWTASETPVAHDFDGGSFELQDGSFVQADFFHHTRSVLYADGHADKPIDPQGG